MLNLVQPRSEIWDRQFGANEDGITRIEMVSYYTFGA
jgi:hypothetical protein